MVHVYVAQIKVYTNQLSTASWQPLLQVSKRKDDKCKFLVLQNIDTQLYKTFLKKCGWPLAEYAKSVLFVTGGTG